jgi:hypothetical protein
MQIALEATPDNPNKVALLYGPLVLAGERGTEGMQAPAPFSNPALYNDIILIISMYLPICVLIESRYEIRNVLCRYRKRTGIYNRTRRCDSSAL